MPVKRSRGGYLGGSTLLSRTGRGFGGGPKSLKKKELEEIQRKKKEAEEIYAALDRLKRPIRDPKL